MFFRHLTTHFVVLLALTAGMVLLGRAQTATVVVAPVTKNVSPTGGDFTLNVNILNAVNVHAFHVVLSLNNAVIRYAGISEGTFLDSAGVHPTFFTSTPTPGPAVTHVTIDDAILADNGTSGGGTLVTITFAPVANGRSSVSLDTVDLRDPNLQQIPVQLTSGTVNVNNPAQVVISPATKNALPTTTSIVLSVNISTVFNVHAFHVIFNLNNAIVRYAGRAEGSFLSSGGATTLFAANPLPGPAVTSVTVDDAILGPDPVTGDGTLFTITLASVASGTSPLTLASVDLRDENNNSVPAQLTSGVVNVNNPATVYVDPTYNPGNQGGHDFGYDGFNLLADGLAAVNVGGTVDIAPSTYSGTFTVSRNLTLTPMSGTPVIQNLTLNTPAASLGGSFQVSGTLTLTSGVLTTGSNAISITDTAANAVVISSGSVNGQVNRFIAANSTSTYLFTDANTSLRPSGVQGAISASIRSFPGTIPPNTNGNAINRYYTITPSGALTATLRLSYLDAEINSVPESTMTLFRSSGIVWTQVASIPNPANNYVEAAGVSTFSTWTIGNLNEPLPIQLASFTGNVVDNGNVQLTWVTLSEVNNYGFYVQRKRPSDQTYQDVSDLIPGHGTTNEPHTYTFTDLAPGTGAWSYRLKQVDLNGTPFLTEPILINVLASVTEDNRPLTFALKQNYPNPFNPVTTFEFSLAKSGYTTLKIYNILGKEVASLVDGVVDAGRRSVKWDASALPSGMYLYKLTSGSFVETMKLVLMK